MAKDFTSKEIGTASVQTSQTSMQIRAAIMGIMRQPAPTQLTNSKPA